MAKSLFDLEREFEAVVALCEGVTSEEQQRFIDEWLTENQSILDEKIDGYVFVIRKFESERDFLKDEAKRLADRAKASEMLAKTLRDRLAYVLANIAPEGIKTARNTIAVCQTKSKLELDENVSPKDLPAQFQIKTIVIEANWEEIEWAIQEGEVIPGVISVGGTPFVKIR